MNSWTAPPRPVAVLEGETEFEVRVLVDRCIVEFFLQNGRQVSQHVTVFLP